MSGQRGRARTGWLKPGQVGILEGLLKLYWEELRRLLQTMVYVDLEDETCFARRLARDVRERGRTAESVQWEKVEQVPAVLCRLYCWLSYVRRLFHQGSVFVVLGCRF